MLRSTLSKIAMMLALAFPVYSGFQAQAATKGTHIASPQFIRPRVGTRTPSGRKGFGTPGKLGNANNKGNKGKNASKSRPMSPQFQKCCAVVH